VKNRIPTYGSKWHLFRYLGYHRAALDRHIEDKIRGQNIRWVDFHFDPQADFLDAERKGLDFLADDLPVQEAWKDFWPQTGNVPNWDAVGWIHVGSQPEVLLVEAKSHPREVISKCGAKEAGGLNSIKAALEQAKAAFGVPAHHDWLKPYYQYCNRLAVLYFLVKNNIAARLLFIYFLGDRIPNCECSKDEAGWDATLQQMYAHIGLTGKSALEGRIHTLFLPVCPP